MRAVYDRLLNEPALIYTAIVTGYGAAIAAGWTPNQAIAIIAAALFAVLGVILRANVTPSGSSPF